MDIITLLIIGFAVYSIFSGVQKTNQTRPRRGNTPWSQIPGIPTTRREIFQPFSRPSFEERGEPDDRTIPSSMRSDTQKEEELIRAEGHEGEWGDEGRSDTTGTFSGEGRSESKEFILSTKPKEQEKEKKFQGEYPRKQGVSQSISDDRINPDLSRWNQNDLIRGIVWAEVLNTPRALKKFRGPRS